MRFEPSLLVVLTAVAMVVSRVGARDPATWLMEAVPVLVALPFLIATYDQFRLTRLVYRLLFLHGLILLLGAHYTYAEVPLGFWMQDVFGFTRNHYDRIGHLAQGFIPAIVAREILLRRSPLLAGRWLFFLVCCVCLALSALYELIEWWAALIGGESAAAFLGTQGDVWDSQWDMFMALVGAIVAQLLLAPLHDRELRQLYAE